MWFCSLVSCESVLLVVVVNVSPEAHCHREPVREPHLLEVYDVPDLREVLREVDVVVPDVDGLERVEDVGDREGVVELGEADDVPGLDVHLVHLKLHLERGRHACRISGVTGATGSVLIFWNC